MAFIYQIRRTATEQCYVGHTTKQVEVRWAAHLALLSVGKHHSRYLQAAWNKEGVGAFEFSLIEQCEDSDKLVREQFYIDALNSVFNTAKVAGSRIGVLYTEEQKIRLSAQRLGHTTTDEAKRKIGLAHQGKQWKLGYKLTDEQRARCSSAQTGISRPYAAANAAIARESSPANKPGWIPIHRIGMKDTPEVIEKRRQSVIAALAQSPLIWITDNTNNIRHPAADPIPDGWYRGRTFSEDHKAATLVASSGPRTAEVRAAIKAGHAGIWDDPEKRQRMMANRRPFGWWTDETVSKRVPIGEAPPLGWRPGKARTKKLQTEGEEPNATSLRPLLL